MLIGETGEDILLRYSRDAPYHESHRRSGIPKPLFKAPRRNVNLPR